MSSDDPQRILIVRLSALGDVLLSSGLIPALRARWPDASLSWLVESAAAPLLAHNPRLDELLILPKAEWKALWRSGRRWQALRGLLAFRRLLRSRHYDLVVDPQGLLKSGLCAWMSGARRRVSLLPREGNQWLMHETVQPAVDAAPLIGHEYRALARYLGAADADFKLDLAIGGAARQRARQALDQACVRGPYAVLAAFTTRPQKHWLESYWAELADGLLQQGLTPVLLGGPGDRQAAERIGALNPRIVSLVGRLELDESVAAIAGSALVVGVDTGLTHMGIALDIPTVALFGSTAPYLHGGHSRSVVLYDRLPCSPCHRNPSCNGRFDCMRQLDVARVLSATLRAQAQLQP